ncbi:Nn.00g022740.m01.CDS01 [Neocucurbitaria sp. VM-36]
MESVALDMAILGGLLEAMSPHGVVVFAGAMLLRTRVLETGVGMVLLKYTGSFADVQPHGTVVLELSGTEEEEGSVGN